MPSSVIGWPQLMNFRYLCLFASVLTLVAACDDNRQRQADDPTAAPPVSVPSVTTAPPVTGELVRVDDVTAAIDRYVGRTVSVTGTIDEVYTPYAFRLRGEGGASGGDALLIVSAAANEWNFAAFAERTVSVTGVVGRFSPERAREVTGRELPPELRARDGEPFLVATRLTAQERDLTPSAPPARRD